MEKACQAEGSVSLKKGQRNLASDYSINIGWEMKPEGKQGTGLKEPIIPCQGVCMALMVTVS